MNKVYFILVLSTLLVSCKNNSNDTYSIPSNEIIETAKQDGLSGEQLSKIYCIACHQYPEPEMLTVDIWKDYMLPSPSPPGSGFLPS